MITDRDMIEPKDDRRHAPAPDSLPLWNESYWFSFYDPAVRIGVVTRIGILANQNQANVWYYISKDGRMAHVGTNLACPVPAGDIDNLKLGGATYRCLEPLRAFQLLYSGDGASMDVTWRGAHPVCLYPVPPGATESQFPRHIEQGGRVQGAVTIGRDAYSIDTFGHRDHSWGGERDWTRLGTWHYISGDFKDFSFNAIHIAMEGGEFTAGYCWDGKEILGTTDVKTTVATDSTGRRQTRAEISFVDEHKRAHEINAKVLDVCEVDLGRTFCNDGFAEFRMGDRIGYGIVELGLQHP